MRLSVVACDSKIVSASGKDAQQPFFDVGVAPIAASEPLADGCPSDQFDTTVGLSSLQKLDVVDFPNGAVALKPHDSKSKSRNQKSIETNEHGLVQLSRAHPGDER